MWGTLVSDMQTSVVVANRAITGTLHYISEGQIVSDWGEGHFLALKFSNIDPSATSVRVGLSPSQGSGLVELDEDLNGMFKITATTQKLVVVTTDGTNTKTDKYDLSNLVLEPEE